MNKQKNMEQKEQILKEKENSKEKNKINKGTSQCRSTRKSESNISNKYSKIPNMIAPQLYGSKITNTADYREPEAYWNWK